MAKNYDLESLANTNQNLRNQMSDLQRQKDEELREQEFLSNQNSSSKDLNRMTFGNSDFTLGHSHQHSSDKLLDAKIQKLNGNSSSNEIPTKTQFQPEIPIPTIKEEPSHLSQHSSGAKGNIQKLLADNSEESIHRSFNKLVPPKPNQDFGEFGHSSGQMGNLGNSGNFQQNLEFKGGNTKFESKIKESNKGIIMAGDDEFDSAYFN